ncbi:MAG: beta-ketoacyl-ACP synthase III [Anaerolineae bacterium]
MTRYAHITGWGKYLPRVVLTNDDMAQIVDTSDEWIVEHTGIRRRHIATGDETVVSMALEAAQEALATAGRSPDDLDLIIVSTSSPDRQLPGAAPILQARLGASNSAAFDMRSGCAGFIYALSIARQFIVGGNYRCVLVVGAEVVSRNLDWSDRRTCVLFGDGAGAAILEAGESPGGVIHTALGTQGQDYDALTVKTGGSEYPMCPVSVERKWNTIEMDGRRTAMFAVRTLLRRANQAVTDAGLTWDDIDLFIPHQANVRLIEMASERLNVPMERIFVNVDRYANMSTASVPVALAEAAQQGRIRDGQHVLLLAFGAGLSWATAVIRWGTGEGESPATYRQRRSIARTRQRLANSLLGARLALFGWTSRIRQRRRKR